MAWVRKVRTASGATAVQIAESVAGKRRIVAHVGSAHTEAELGILLEHARALLGDPDQGALDFATPPAARTARLVPAPTSRLWRPPAVAAVERDGAGRVVGTGSGTLAGALEAIYDQLGFNTLGDDTFRDLVIARLVEPTSLRDVGRVLRDVDRTPPSESTLRRCLQRAAANDYRGQIAAACFARATRSGDVSLVLYDVTTLYFEAEKEDDLRKVGFSKERRVDPQIVVGLLVDRGGFPLEIGCFEGNKAETRTIVPIVREFQARHDVAHMVVVADAGMLSGVNLTALDEADLHFIVGSRTTKAPIDLASHFRWNGDAFTDGQVIDTITPKDSRVLENDPLRRAEPVWDPAAHPASWRAVWAYSRKRAVRDRHTLTAQANRARAIVEGAQAGRAARFVKVAGGARSLDEKALERAESLVGLKGYVTNLPAHLMSAGEVIGSYHELWQVEASFRMSKTDLRARPMFVRTRDAIEAHLTVVFTALAVAREAQDRSGLAIRKIVRQLRPLRSATIAINGTRQTFEPEINDTDRALLDALHGRRSRH